MKSRAFIVIIAFCAILLSSTIMRAQQSIWFVSPANGSTFYIEPGNTTFSFEFRYDYTVGSPPDWGPFWVYYSVDGVEWLEDPGANKSASSIVNAGDHVLYLELWQRDQHILQDVPVAFAQLTFHVVQKYNVTVGNDFAGGKVKVDSYEYTEVSLAGIQFPWPQGTQHSLLAFDNQTPPDGLPRYFKRWTKNEISFFSQLGTTTDPVTADARYTATFRREFSVSATTAVFVESGSGGTYKVNGSNVGASWAGTYIEEVSSPIQLEAVAPTGFNFLAWDDGDRANPRTLIPTANTSRYAIFKKPVQSSANTALSTNSQRKLISLLPVAGVTKTFMAYESGNGAFLTYRDDVVGVWENEIPIGGPPTASVHYKYPTLIPYGTGTTFDMLYDVYSVGTSTHTLKMDAYSELTGNIYPFFQVDAFSAPSTYNPHASAAWTKPLNGEKTMLAVVWLNGNMKYIGLGGYNASQDFSFSATDLNSQIWLTATVSNIAVAGDIDQPGKPYENVYVVWEEPGASGGIRMAHGHVSTASWPPNAATNISWQGTPAIKTVASNTSGGVVHKNPSLAIDGSRNLFIAWEYTDPNLSFIKVQKRYFDNMGNGDPVYTFPDNSNLINSASPCLTDFRYSASNANNMAISFYKNSTAMGVYYAYFKPTGGYWTSDYLVSENGRAVAIESDLNATETGRNMVFVNLQGPPHALSLVPSPPTVELNPPPGPTLFGSDTTINGSKRPKLFWTPSFGNVTNYKVYRYFCDIEYPDCGEEGIGTLIATIPGNQTSHVDLGVIVCDHYCNTSVHYFVKAKYADNAMSLASNEQTFNESIQTRQNPIKPFEELVSELELPTVTSISANYPNPFNPCTRFEYQLAQPGMVSLVIYNILGQEVARLVEGSAEAGRYSASWNAGSSPSGLYYARFVVQGAAGNEVYKEMRKLLYIR